MHPTDFKSEKSSSPLDCSEDELTDPDEAHVKPCSDCGKDYHFEEFKICCTCKKKLCDGCIRTCSKCAWAHCDICLWEDYLKQLTCWDCVYKDARKRRKQAKLLEDARQTKSKQRLDAVGGPASPIAKPKSCSRRLNLPAAPKKPAAPSKIDTNGLPYLIHPPSFAPSPHLTCTQASLSRSVIDLTSPPHRPNPLLASSYLFPDPQSPLNVFEQDENDPQYQCTECSTFWKRSQLVLKQGVGYCPVDFCKGACVLNM